MQTILEMFFSYLLISIRIKSTKYLSKYIFWLNFIMVLLKNLTSIFALLSLWWNWNPFLPYETEGMYLLFYFLCIAICFKFSTYTIVLRGRGICYEKWLRDPMMGYMNDFFLSKTYLSIHCTYFVHDRYIYCVTNYKCTFKIW